MSANRGAFRIVDFEQVPAVRCPCGLSRRALVDLPELPATIHRTQIAADAQAHYHRRLSETYYILECEPDAQIELDGQRFALRPGVCVYIPPGVVHRAIGRMTVLIIVIPKFDPADEVIVGS